MVFFIIEFIDKFLNDPFSYLFHDNMFSLYGSLIGVLGAYLLLKIQSNIDRQNELQAKKPLLLVNNINQRLHNFKIGFDLVNNGKVLRDYEMFSDLTIPLINAGETPISDLRINYTIDNLDELKVYMDSLPPRVNGYLPKIKKEENNIYSITINSNGDSPFVYAKNRFETKHHALLMPGNQLDIHIDVFVCLIWTCIILSEMSSVKDSKESKLKEVNADINLHIAFKDYKNANHEIVYNLNFNKFFLKYDESNFPIITEMLLEIYPNKVSECEKNPSSD